MKKEETIDRNLILGALPQAIQRRLMESSKRIKLRVGDILNEPGDRQNLTIFPETGVISVINTMREGKAIEVATIGREGMSGVPSLL